MNLTDQPDYLTVTGTINPARCVQEYLLTEGLSWNATARQRRQHTARLLTGAGDGLKSPAYWAIKPATRRRWDGKSLSQTGRLVN